MSPLEIPWMLVSYEGSSKIKKEGGEAKERKREDCDEVKRVDTCQRRSAGRRTTLGLFVDVRLFDLFFFFY